MLWQIARLFRRMTAAEAELEAVKRRLALLEAGEAVRETTFREMQLVLTRLLGRLDAHARHDRRPNGAGEPDLFTFKRRGF